MSVIIEPGDWVFFTIGVNADDTKEEIRRLLDATMRNFNDHGILVAHGTAITNFGGLRIDAVVRGSKAAPGPLVGRAV